MTEIDNVILETEENLDKYLDTHNGNVVKTWSRKVEYSPKRQEAEKTRNRVQEDQDIYCNCGEEFNNEQELKEHVNEEYNPNGLLLDLFEGEVGIHGFEPSKTGHSNGIIWTLQDETDLGVMVYATIDYNGVTKRKMNKHYVHLQAMTVNGQEIQSEVETFHDAFTPRTYFKIVRDFIENTVV